MTAACMIEHRAAVKERLVDQEADLSRRAVEGLRKLNLGRDQILARLWELATLSNEATRGIIAGQIKALSMIVAIEGPDPEPTAEPAPRTANLSHFNLDRNQTGPLNPFIKPEALNRVPETTSFACDAVLDRATPSGCPSLETDASLGGGAEVIKRPNFIEFYEISRSLHADKTSRGSREQGLYGRHPLKRKPSLKAYGISPARDG
jgi:hypothetical protein